MIFRNRSFLQITLPIIFEQSVFFAREMNYLLSTDRNISTFVLNSSHHFERKHDGKILSIFEDDYHSFRISVSFIDSLFSPTAESKNDEFHFGSDAGFL